MAQVEHNIAQCSLCEDFYNIPRMFPCQHTFCENCITHYIGDHAAKANKKKISHFPCPQCNKRIKLELNQEDNIVATQYPINLTIQAMLETEPVMVKLRKLAKKTKKKDTNQETKTKDKQQKTTALKGNDGTFMIVQCRFSLFGLIFTMIKFKTGMDKRVTVEKDALPFIEYVRSANKLAHNFMSMCFLLGILNLCVLLLLYWFPKLLIIFVVFDMGSMSRRRFTLHIIDRCDIKQNNRLFNYLLLVQLDLLIFVVIFVYFYMINKLTSYLIPSYHMFYFLNQQYTDGYMFAVSLTFSAFTSITRHVHYTYTKQVSENLENLAIFSMLIHGIFHYVVSDI